MPGVLCCPDKNTASQVNYFTTDAEDKYRAKFIKLQLSAVEEDPSCVTATMKHACVFRLCAHP